MNQATYRVARGCLKLPRDPKSGRNFSTSADFIKQGEIVPQGLLSPQQIESLLSDGRIELLTPSEAVLAERVPKTRGVWSVDPTALVGKSMEELLVMVLEIDPNFDVTQITVDADAVRQLTADWDPAFRDVLAKSNDKSRPEALRLKSSQDGRVVRSNTHDAGERPMSEAAQRALAMAREKANPTSTQS